MGIVGLIRYLVSLDVRLDIGPNGRVVLDGPNEVVTDFLVEVCRASHDKLRNAVIGVRRKFGWASCDVCGESPTVKKRPNQKCRLTPGCKGHVGDPVFPLLRPGSPYRVGNKPGTR